MIRYIEIDSTYRERNRFPNPAQFDVNMSGSGTKANSLESLDPVSNQVPTFPEYQTIDPIAFFTDTDSSTTERQYLPYMFQVSTTTPTLLQLDELPIAPTDPVNQEVVITDQYARGSIPLGKAETLFSRTL